MHIISSFKLLLSNYDCVFTVSLCNSIKLRLAFVSSLTIFKLVYLVHLRLIDTIKYYVFNLLKWNVNDVMWNKFIILLFAFFLFHMFFVPFFCFIWVNYVFFSISFYLLLFFWLLAVFFCACSRDSTYVLNITIYLELIVYNFISNVKII